MKLHLKKSAIGSFVAVIGMAGIAVASNVNVGVEVTTPNVRVRASNAPPPQQVTVVERERIIIREKDSKHDKGKHKGHYKKHKKKKHHDD